MTLVTTTIPTPPGPFTVIAREQADGSAVVLASGWAPDAAALLETIGPVRLAGAGVGALGGFLYGLDVKRWLLEHEAAPAAA